MEYRNVTLTLRGRFDTPAIYPYPPGPVSTLSSHHYTPTPGPVSTLSSYPQEVRIGWSAALESGQVDGSAAATRASRKDIENDVKRVAKMLEMAKKEKAKSNTT